MGGEDSKMGGAPNCNVTEKILSFTYTLQRFPLCYTYVLQLSPLTKLPFVRCSCILKQQKKDRNQKLRKPIYAFCHLSFPVFCGIVLVLLLLVFCLENSCCCYWFLLFSSSKRGFEQMRLFYHFFKNNCISISMI